MMNAYNPLEGILQIARNSRKKNRSWESLVFLNFKDGEIQERWKGRQSYDSLPPNLSLSPMIVSGWRSVNASSWRGLDLGGWWWWEDGGLWKVKLKLMIMCESWAWAREECWWLNSCHGCPTDRDGWDYSNHGASLQLHMNFDSFWLLHPSLFWYANIQIKNKILARLLPIVGGRKW